MVVLTEVHTIFLSFPLSNCHHQRNLGGSFFLMFSRFDKLLKKIGDKSSPFILGLLPESYSEATLDINQTR